MHNKIAFHLVVIILLRHLRTVLSCNSLKKTWCLESNKSNIAFGDVSNIEVGMAQVASPIICVSSLLYYLQNKKLSWHCVNIPLPFVPFNTLRPRQNGRHFADDILKRIFFNENVWISINISLSFVPKGPIDNIPSLV